MPGRLIVRRIPDLNAEKHRAAGQDTLFDLYRFHAFFTTTDPADRWIEVKRRRPETASGTVHESDEKVSAQPLSTVSGEATQSTEAGASEILWVLISWSDGVAAPAGAATRRGSRS